MVGGSHSAGGYNLQMLQPRFLLRAQHCTSHRKPIPCRPPTICCFLFPFPAANTRINFWSGRNSRHGSCIACLVSGTAAAQTRFWIVSTQKYAEETNGSTDAHTHVHDRTCLRRPVESSHPSNVSCNGSYLSIYLLESVYLPI